MSAYEGEHTIFGFLGQANLTQNYVLQFHPFSPFTTATNTSPKQDLFILPILLFCIRKKEENDICACLVYFISVSILALIEVPHFSIIISYDKLPQS
jgi:hypothetical protein